MLQLGERRTEQIHTAHTVDENGGGRGSGIPGQVFILRRLLLLLLLRLRRLRLLRLLRLLLLRLILLLLPLLQHTRPEHVQGHTRRMMVISRLRLVRARSYVVPALLRPAGD